MTAIEDPREVQIRSEEPGRESWAISLTTGAYTDTLRMTESEARLVHRALGARLAPPTDDEREALATEYARQHGDSQTRSDFLAGYDSGFRRQGQITDALDAIRSSWEVIRGAEMDMLAGRPDMDAMEEIALASSQIDAALEAARDAS